MAAGIDYTLRWSAPNEHTYIIEMRFARQPGATTDLKMPLWRPGRYITQDFAAAVYDFSARDGNQKPLNWQKTDKDTWRVKNPPAGDITVTYRCYANTQDAGSSWLDRNIAYFNPSNIFMCIAGGYDLPCKLTVPDLPDNWKTASALQTTAARNIFTAATYHDFIDSPTIFSPDLKQFQFDFRGVKYYIHFQGKYTAPAGAEDTLIAAIKSIVAEQTAIIGELPIKYYHFIYLLLPFQIRHAVEHAYSAMFAMPEELGASAESLRGLFSITSHEFWHLWNVKRIRPAAMWPYDYSRPQFTTLHWFTEGVTDYYTDLALVRGKIITPEQYFENWCKALTALENSYAARNVSPAQASFDSWLAPSNYAVPFLRTSYYALGERVGLILDLEIRKLTNNQKSLDDVMRDLYVTYYKKNLGVPEYGVQQSVEKLTGKSFETFFQKYVHGVEPIDWNSFLKPFGLEYKVTLNPGYDFNQIGISRLDFGRDRSSALVSSVIIGSDAAAAGLSDDDIITKINNKPLASFTAEDLTNLFKALKPGDAIQLEVQSFDGRRSITVNYTGKNIPKKVTLLPVPGADTRWQQAWLQSKANS
jgi:predicted metalloprotease with PDZ domain